MACWFLSLLCAVMILMFKGSLILHIMETCDQRNAEITVYGLWVVSIKFESGAGVSQRRALPGCEAAD